MFGVYKTYDGNCNDSPHFWFFEDEKDAIRAVEKLEALRLDGRKDVYLAYNEGWEFNAYWTYEEVAPKPTTMEDFNKEIEKVENEMKDYNKDCPAVDE